MTGVPVTWNGIGLLDFPETITNALPVVAPAGTGTTTLVALQLVGVATIPLNVTVLDPCVAPKFSPVIVTEVPGVPAAGLMVVTLGFEFTINGTVLLVIPPTVTTTLPLVAPEGTGTAMLVQVQLVGDATVPLNVTVLVDCAAPKSVPEIVIDAPTGPEFGLALVMLGPVATTKGTELLAAPPTVTIRLPDAAALGTRATIYVLVQTETVAAMPLNATELVPWLDPKLEPLIDTGWATPPDSGVYVEM
jgi:hypothetical protein